MQSRLWTSLVIFGMFFRYGTLKHIPSFAGPYRVIGRRFGNESEYFRVKSEHLILRGRFSSPKPGQKQYVWGAFYMSHPLNDDILLQVLMSVWANNQWKRNAFVLKFVKACSSLLFHGKSVAALMFEPHELKCPIAPVGHRELKNQTFEPVFPHFPVVPYGRYLFEALFTQENKSGILVADVEVVPKL